MRLIFLGTGGYHPNERRHTAGVLLPEIGVLFDAGTSLFRVTDHLQTDDLHIFLTHTHLDHVAGLTFLLVPLLDGRIKQARVSGTEGNLTAVREHLFSEALFPVLPDFSFTPLESVTSLPDGGRLTCCPLKHPGGCLGFKITWPDRSLAYITDTTVDGSYTEFIRGVDVLIHECYFHDDMAEWAEKTGHSHTSQVAGLARAAGVKRLLLTHIDPQRPDDDPIGMATARAIFPATELAEDLLEIEF